MVKAFTVTNFCRHCLIEKDHLHFSESYKQIHADAHEKRTKEMFLEDLSDMIKWGVKHVRSVCSEPFMKDVPYFDFSKQTVQCPSHDVFEARSLCLDII